LFFKKCRFFAKNSKDKPILGPKKGSSAPPILYDKRRSCDSPAHARVGGATRARSEPFTHAPEHRKALVGKAQLPQTTTTTTTSNPAIGAVDRELLYIEWGPNSLPHPHTHPYPTPPQPTNQPTNQPTSQPASQPASQPTHLSHLGGREDEPVRREHRRAHPLEPLEKSR
jgi:hypothetical protein